ncbi:hypothetical protein CEXT_397741 [Caerostris extrusa]|uniref:Uncharacterized protein n=1 Tax=Caerostris extrusa TaxID=172846 RepID=A0AAV4XQ34_CAEEX|nr:hypothetical protein CEXT_397741 [Caerostris extrusa]
MLSGSSLEEVPSQVSSSSEAFRDGTSRGALGFSSSDPLCICLTELFREIRAPHYQMRRTPSHGLLKCLHHRLSEKGSYQRAVISHKRMISTPARET